MCPNSARKQNPLRSTNSRNHLPFVQLKERVSGNTLYKSFRPSTTGCTCKAPPPSSAQKKKKKRKRKEEGRCSNPPPTLASRLVCENHPGDAIIRRLFPSSLNRTGTFNHGKKDVVTLVRKGQKRKRSLCLSDFQTCPWVEWVQIRQVDDSSLGEGKKTTGWETIGCSDNPKETPH